MSALCYSNSKKALSSIRRRLLFYYNLFNFSMQECDCAAGFDLAGAAFPQTMNVISEGAL